MIVLRTKFVEPTEDTREPLVTIEAEGNGYRVKRLNAGTGPDLLVSPTDIEPWGRKVFYWSAYGDGFLCPADYEGSRDCDTFMRSRFGCSEGPVLVAARGGDDQLVLVAFAPVHTKLEYVHHNAHGPAIDAVEYVLPGYKTSARAVANKAKRDLLAAVNPMDMLAEQEKQIDLLSLLVVELAEKQPASDRPAWLPAFKAMLEAASSVQFKGVTGALEDVVARKSHMRELQRTYLGEKNLK